MIINKHFYKSPMCHECNFSPLSNDQADCKLHTLGSNVSRLHLDRIHFPWLSVDEHYKAIPADFDLIKHIINIVLKNLHSIEIHCPDRTKSLNSCTVLVVAPKIQIS